MNENEETKINNGDYTPIKRTPTEEPKIEINNNNSSNDNTPNVVLNNQNVETQNTVTPTYNNQINNVTPNIISVTGTPQVLPKESNNPVNEPPKEDNNNNNNTSNTLENNQKLETPNNETNNSSQEEEKSNTLEIGLLVIFFIIIIVDIFTIMNKITLSFIINIYITILIYLGYKRAKEKKTVAVKYGIGIGVFLILTSGLLGIILGIFTIIDAVNYNKKFKGVKKPKKEWLTIVYIFAIYFALIFLIVFINVLGILNPRLKCTRRNGDEVVYRFNYKGVRNMSVNGKRHDEQADTVNALYNINFYLHSHDDEPVQEYIDIVRGYEEDIFGSVCK